MVESLLRSLNSAGNRDWERNVDEGLVERQLPVVSAVIPTHNRPELLLRAVKSALDQTCPDIEVIAVVDGPDPESMVALSTVTDTRLRVVALDVAVGAAEARNVGIRTARGKWIALLDDDDEWAPEKITKQLGAAEGAGNPYVLVFSRMIARLPQVEYIWPRRLPEPNESMSDYLFCRKGLAFGEGFLQTSSFFAARAMFEEVPFRKNQQRFQDTDWILRACAHPQSQFVVLPEALVHYHMDSQRESISRKPDWAYLHKWAVENRKLFTARAFSFFLATQCIPRAAKQNERIGVFFQLVRECIFDGSASPTCLLLCGLFWWIPEPARQGMRDFFWRGKKKEGHRDGARLLSTKPNY